MRTLKSKSEGLVLSGGLHAETGASFVVERVFLFGLEGALTKGVQGVVLASLHSLQLEKRQSFCSQDISVDGDCPSC